MGSDPITLFANLWAVVWMAVFGLGYAAEQTPWPQLKSLRSPATSRVMVFASAAVVLGLTLGGASEPGAVLAAWAIVIASVKLLCEGLGQTE